jgi:hypothetical protein
LEGSQFEGIPGKKFQRPHFSQQRAGHCGICCQPNYMRTINRRTAVQASSGIKAQCYSKTKNKNKKKA